MPTQVIPLEGIDKHGVIKDSPSSTLPPGAWTDANNVRFDDGAIRRMRGEEIIFQHASLTDIKHVVYWENPNVRCYVAVNGESDGDHVYLVTVNGDGDTIVDEKTRVDENGDVVPYVESNDWNSTQFNGGYSIIINSTRETPQHITVQLGGSSDITGIANFEDLPGWDSYASGSYVSEYLSVTADILISYGNLLVAGALTERSLPQLPVITDITLTDASDVTITFSGSLPGLLVDDQIEIFGDPDYTWTWTVTGDGTLIDPDTTQTAVVSSPYNQVYTITDVGVNSIEATPATSFNADVVEPDLELTDDFDPADLDTVTPDFSGSGDVTSYFIFQDGSSEAPQREIVRDLNGVVRTSSVAAPGAIPNNWNPFAPGAGTADELSLANGGKITAVHELRGNLFVYTSDTITQLRVSAQGLTAVPITRQYGASHQNSVFEFQGTHLVIGSDDIYLFAGNPGDIKSVADGRVRNFFYDELHPVLFRNTQIVRNQAHDELWICYPERTSTGGLTRAMVWSYINNNWTFRDLPNSTSLTIGPIPGDADTILGQRVSVPTDAVYYRLTVNTPDGRTVVMPDDPFVGTFTTAQLRTAVNIDVNGQGGLVSRIEDAGTLLISDARIGANAWTYEIEWFDSSMDSVEGTAVDITLSFTNAERPWLSSILNEARNFVVMTGTVDDITSVNAIKAAELGFLFRSGNRQPGVERTNLHFAPSKRTETLNALYMNTETITGQSTILTVSLGTKDTAGQIATSSSMSYDFDTIEDYKVDTRITSRLVDLAISEPGEFEARQWDIASIELEVGIGGTR